MQCSAVKDFLYITNPKTYYEHQDCFLFVDVPVLPPRQKVHIEHADLLFLQDYKAKYLHGVRQNSIRKSNNKDIKQVLCLLMPTGHLTLNQNLLILVNYFVKILLHLLTQDQMSL